MPHQLKRIAARGENGLGDIFLAFSTANPDALEWDRFVKLTELPNDRINPLFEATVQAVEKPVLTIPSR